MATQSVKNVVINVKANTKGIKDLQTEVNKLEKENKQLADQFTKTNKKLGDGMKNTSNEVGLLTNQLKNLGGVIAGAFTVGAMVQFGKAVLNTRAEFQKLEAVLTNTLGSSSEAQRSLAQIQNFASKTPFSVVELTQSFVKLVNQGFKPTVNELRKLGDLASSTGKQFDQLAEAIIDAQTGEFERLKEFGIRASKQGDQVQFTFKGVQTQVEFTDKAIRNYITSLGDLEGVSGSMEAISRTLGGQISNLGDAWESLLNTLGTEGEGVMSNSIAFLSKTLEITTDLIKGVEKLRGESELMYLGTNAESIQQELNNRVKAGEQENEIKQDIIQRLAEERQGMVKNLKAGQQLYDSTKIWEFEKRRLILKRLTEMEGEIDANQKLIRQLKDMTADLGGDPADQSKGRTINMIKKEIKAVTEAMGDYQIGSQDLSNAIERLKDLQEELNEALGKGKKHMIEIATIEESDEIQKAYEERLKKEQDANQKMLDEMEAYYEEDGKKSLKHADTLLKQDQEEHKKRLEEQKKFQKEREAINDAWLEATESTADLIVENEKTRLDRQYEYEQRILDARLRSNKISQNEYEVEQKKLLREQAERQKRLAIFEINVAGAIASAKVWSENPNPVVAGILQAIVLAETFSQLAIVNSEPLPVFEKGGWIGGKLHREGGTIIEAERDEFMVSRRFAKQNKDLLENVNAGQGMEYINKMYVYPAMEQTRMDIMRDKSFAESVAKSIKTHASLDDGNIVGWLGRIDKTSKRNTDTLVSVLKSNRKDIRDV